MSADNPAIPSTQSSSSGLAAADVICVLLLQAVEKLKNKQSVAITQTLESLDIDELDLLEMTVELEKKLGIEIDDAKLLQAQTLADIASLLTKPVGTPVTINPVIVDQWKQNVADKYMPTIMEAGVVKSVPNTEVAKETLNEMLVQAETESLYLGMKKKWKKSYAEQAADTPEAAVDHVLQVKKMLEEAEQEDDYVIVPADPTILQIDLDEKESVLLFKERYELFQKSLPKLDLSNITYTRSKSMRWHVTIQLTTSLSTHERIFLQMALGSDPMREMLAFINHSKGHSNTILFLERKEEWAKQKKLTT